MHISIGPAAVKQANPERVCPGFVWEPSRQPQATPLCIVCVFSLPSWWFALRVVYSRWWCCSVVVLTADSHGNPSRSGGSFPPHRPAGSCCHWRERRREKNKRGAFSFNPPDATKRRGLHFSSAGCIHQSCRFFTPPSLPGLKGGRKETRHSTSFADRVSFPGCSVYLVGFKCLMWMQCAFVFILGLWSCCGPTTCLFKLHLKYVGLTCQSLSP